MDLDDATYLDMGEEEIRACAWFQHTTSTYEQLYLEDNKAGIHVVHCPDSRHHEHDKQWVLEDTTADVDNPLTIEAFQACLFEDGSEVPGRYHGLPETTQKRFLGFQDIVEDCNRWFRPWTSKRASFKFHEVLRQYADLYPAFRTPNFFNHVLKVSNVIYHPFVLFARRGEEGIQRIPVIWQTPWLRTNVTIQALESWILTGIWPMLSCNKIQLSMEVYFTRSKEYILSLSATKRPRQLAHTGGLQRLNLRVVGLGLQDHPISKLTNKRGKQAPEPDEPNSHKGKYTHLLAADAHNLIENRDNMISTAKMELASAHLKIENLEKKTVILERALLKEQEELKAQEAEAGDLKQTADFQIQHLLELKSKLLAEKADYLTLHQNTTEAWQ
jgi:hypothetical protein